LDRYGFQLVCCKNLFRECFGKYLWDFNGWRHRLNRLRLLLLHGFNGRLPDPADLLPVLFVRAAEEAESEYHYQRENERALERAFRPGFPGFELGVEVTFLCGGNTPAYGLTDQLAQRLFDLARCFIREVVDLRGTLAAEASFFRWRHRVPVFRTRLVDPDIFHSNSVVDEYYSKMQGTFSFHKPQDVLPG
jgi:hypothetical protein